MKISVVDQSPIFSNTDANQALIDSIELAKLTDSYGLHRYWVAEHHGSLSFAGCAPEIFIPKIASATSSIRVGSGGVMLMHYSPYKVAENFRLLESLYPKRIDLGLGRAPGSDPYQAGALAYGSKTTGPDFFPTKMNDLQSFLHGNTPDTDAFKTVNVTPGLGNVPETWLLVSSKQGAEYAAHFGLPMSLAYFIDQDCLPLADYYRKNFTPSDFSSKPRVSVGVFAICAETDEQAVDLSLSASLWRKKIQLGDFSPFPTQSEAKSTLNGNISTPADNRSFIGSPKTIKKALQPLLDQTQAEELKIVTICEPFSARAESYRLIRELFS